MTVCTSSQLFRALQLTATNRS